MQQPFLSRFAKNKRGNIALMTALAAIPMIVLAGGAVDLMRITAARTEVQGALDAGVLAAASLSNTRNSTDVVREYLDTNVHPTILDPSSISLSVNSTESGRFSEVEGSASFSINTQFVSLIGIDQVNVGVTSAASQGIANVEISLVLDVSGSMDGEKIVSLRNDASAFVTEMLDASPKDSTSISIIPYSSNVTIGSNFSRYLDPDTINRNDIRDYLCDGAGPTCSLADFSEDEIDDAAIAVWNGCLDYELADFDDGGGTLPLRARPATVSPNVDNNKDDCRPGVEPVFLSQTKETLTAQIRKYVASGETAMHVATMWGYKALSDSWRGKLGGEFANRPTELRADEAFKVLVVMTDGRINPHDADISKNMAATKFLDICTEAKMNKVSVWAIGFQIEEGSEEDVLLRQCPNNASQYLLSGDSSLSEEFDLLYEFISKLRLIG